MDAEFLHNSKALNMCTNMTVCYGDEIQLKHTKSNMFLNGKEVASETEKSAYLFEVTDEFQYGMIFRIYPKFKLRNVG